MEKTEELTPGTNCVLNWHDYFENAFYVSGNNHGQFLETFIEFWKKIKISNKNYQDNRLSNFNAS